MWIVCLADNSHEISSFIFSEKFKKERKYFRMLSATAVTGIFMVNLVSDKFEQWTNIRIKKSEFV